MKSIVLVLCVLLGAAYATPLQPSRTSALDLFSMLEKIVEDEGHALLSKVVQVIHKIEAGIDSVQKLVPKEFENFHQEAVEVLAELKKLANDVQELLVKKTGDVYFGFDLLSGLTELTGGTKLSTVISLLQLADKAHRVVEDAKNFTPNLEKELDKIQSKIAEHVSELAKHVVKELGLQEFVSHSVVKKIENLLEEVQEEAHVLLLTVLHNIENTFTLLETEFPEIYTAVKDGVDVIRRESHDIVEDVKKRLNLSYSHSILDIAGDFTSGTHLGTALKVMSLIDKFNTVCQDIRGFGPRAETVLQHSVKKVATSAQDFFAHSAKLLFESY